MFWEENFISNLHKIHNSLKLLTSTQWVTVVKVVGTTHIEWGLQYLLHFTFTEYQNNKYIQ